MAVITVPSTIAKQQNDMYIPSILRRFPGGGLVFLKYYDQGGKAYEITGVILTFWLGAVYKIFQIIDGERSSECHCFVVTFICVVITRQNC